MIGVDLAGALALSRRGVTAFACGLGARGSRLGLGEPTQMRPESTEFIRSEEEVVVAVEDPE
jgi:hypothetical protein